MFSVTLLYSANDFLRLVPEAGMTQEEFKKYFNEFKYSTADRVLQVSFKCGWSQLTKEGQIELTSRGREISQYDYKSALLFQLEDLILNFNPPWASIIPKGRAEAKNFLPPDELQCFKECGLFGSLTSDIVKFWDKLALAYRNYTNQRMTEIGRIGEQLSYDFEFKRTGKQPVWQAVESNLSGFDLLSVVDDSNLAKLKIEVKTTSSDLNYSKIHISKNEWETANSSINYIFHLWQLEPTPKLFIVNLENISKNIPFNNGEGIWESVEIPFKSLI